MALTKHASFQVLAARIATAGAPLMRTAHRHDFAYQPKTGFLYVRSRAISSRTNDNFDEFPAEEIKKAYRTFIGKPVFVNHHNDDHRRARGVIIDAALHEDANADGSPDTWVEVLMEVDAIHFPMLAKAIVKGEIARTSMGCDVAYSECTVCGNRADTPISYCAHVKRMKGQRIYRTTASGTKEGVLVAERCFTPDTPVLMEGGVEVPISEITVGAVVIDHLGQPCAVTETMVNQVDEDIVKIEQVGYGKPTRMTGSHPVLVLPRSKTANGSRQWMTHRLGTGKIAPEFMPASEVRKGDYVAQVVPSFVGSLTEIVTDQWLVPDPDNSRMHPVQTTPDRFYTPDRAWGGRRHTLRACLACGNEMDLYPSDAARMYCSSKCWGDGYARGNSAHAGSLTTTPLPDTIEMDERFGRWCGWFLAEGSISYQVGRRHARGVNFGLHANEAHHAVEIAELGLALFGLKSSVSVKDNRLTIEFYHAPLARMMRVLGDGFFTRALPDEWMSAPVEFLNGVVTAHHDGDGEHNGGRTGGRPDAEVVTHATSSPRLADQLYVLHLMLGHTPTRKRPDPPGGKTKRTVPGHHIRARLDKDAVSRMTWGPWVFARVRSVLTEHYAGPVHNLGVEGTHTYVANHMAVHNCRGLSFFENSLLVEEPADPSAFVVKVDDHSGMDWGLSTTSSKIRVSRDEIETSRPNLLDVHRNAVLDGYHETLRTTAAKRGETQPVLVTFQYEGQPLVRRSFTTMDRAELFMDEIRDNADRREMDVSITVTDRSKTSARTAFRRTAATLNDVERTVAPAQVDTMRTESCPVCSERDSWDGEECKVCGFITPPSEFMDPDLSKAQETDLRQDAQDDPDATGLTCDTCGAQFADSAAPTPAVGGPTVPPVPAASAVPQAHGRKRAVVLDPNNGTGLTEVADTSLSAGDPCPDCGTGTLVADGLDGEVGADGFAPAGSAPDADAADPAADADPTTDPGDAAEDDDAEDDDSGDKPDFLKGKPKKKDPKKPVAARRRTAAPHRPARASQKEQIMRPALAALAEQQKQINELTKAVAFIANVAGVSGHRSVSRLVRRAADENPANSGWAITTPPGQQGSPQSGPAALNLKVDDDAVNIGASPLTDVSPDAQTSPTSVDTILNEPLHLNVQDVTKQVAGTEDLGKGDRGKPGTNRIDTDVRVGDPTDPHPAFSDGGYLSGPDAKAASAQSRTFASLRLARLQIEAGIATGDDLALSQAIASSRVSNEVLQAQIETLAQVASASSASTARRAPGSRALVPRSTRTATRSVPSMSEGAPQPQVSTAVSAEEMLFE